MTPGHVLRHLADLARQAPHWQTALQRRAAAARADGTSSSSQLAVRMSGNGSMEPCAGLGSCLPGVQAAGRQVPTAVGAQPVPAQLLQQAGACPAGVPAALTRSHQAPRLACGRTKGKGGQHQPCHSDLCRDQCCAACSQACLPELQWQHGLHTTMHRALRGRAGRAARALQEAGLPGDPLSLRLGRHVPRWPPARGRGPVRAPRACSATLQLPRALPCPGMLAAIPVCSAVALLPHLLWPCQDGQLPRDVGAGGMSCVLHLPALQHARSCTGPA